MILYENGFIKLDYEPAKDILCSACPDIREIDLLQIHHAFTIIVKNIRHYNIRNLLIDYSNTVIDVSDDDFNTVMNHFMHDLMHTRLRKLARVVTNNTATETKLREYSSQIKKELDPEFALNIFKTKADALNWLLS